MPERRIAYGSVTIGPKAPALIQEALRTTQVSTGGLVPAFEKAFAAIIGAKHAIAVSSGTDACLVIAASLLDRGAARGDEIIVPALTFASTANAVLMAGLMPKFVDIDRSTLNINPKNIEAAITEKTRAIFVVHLMGKPAPLKEIKTIAARHGLAVLEDACEAHGTRYYGERVGSDSYGAAFSLYAAHLICSGEGGLVTTNDDGLKDIYLSLRSHGRPAGKLVFDFQRVGFNSKMNELEAALGLAAAAEYEDILKNRKDNYDFYLKAFSALPAAAKWLGLPVEEEQEVIGPQGFPFVIKAEAPFTLNDLTRALDASGIEWKSLFGSLPTQHRAWQFLGCRPGDFPEAEYVGAHGLHIGVHNKLTASDRQYVVASISDFLARF